MDLDRTPGAQPSQSGASGPAGGVLAGTFPDPTFAADMATQGELDAHVAASDPHGDRAASVAITDPLGFGMPITVHPSAAGTQMAISNGTTRYQRVMGKGTVTSVALAITTQSGNISVGIYANTSSGQTAAPNTRLGTSGAVACPAVGDANVSLGGSVAHAHGDWYACSADNGTVQVRCTSSGGGTGSIVRASGWSTHHPVPSPAAVGTWTLGQGILMVGKA